MPPSRRGWQRRKPRNGHGLIAVAYESSAATKLLVRYSFDALGRVKYSQPQSPHAVFVPDEDALIGEFAPGGGMYLARHCSRTRARHLP